MGNEVDGVQNLCYHLFRYMETVQCLVYAINGKKIVDNNYNYSFHTMIPLPHFTKSITIFITTRSQDRNEKKNSGTWTEWRIYSKTCSFCSRQCSTREHICNDGCCKRIWRLSNSVDVKNRIQISD